MFGKKYPFNKNVPFYMAFKALTEGYMITKSNSNNYMQMVDGKIFNINTIVESGNFRVEEIDVNYMLNNDWKIIKPNTMQYFKK